MEIFDKEGEPISIDEYNSLFGDKSYRFIKQTTLPNGDHISTVWTGETNSYGPNGPQIFETLVKRKEKKYEHEYEIYKYSTEKEATKHHYYLVDLIVDTIPKNIMRWDLIIDEVE